MFENDICVCYLLPIYDFKNNVNSLMMFGDDLLRTSYL